MKTLQKVFAHTPLTSFKCKLLIQTLSLVKNSLTLKVPPIFCSRRQIKNVAAFSKITNKASYFIRIVCDSHEISYLIFFRKLGKMSQNLSSAAVLIGPLRVKICSVTVCYHSLVAQW